MNEPTVSIIDDDPAVRQSLTVLLQSMDYSPQAYGSVQEFLKQGGHARRGCILLDVRLPGTSGLELLEQLAQQQARPAVIVISAYGDVPTVVRAMKAGARNFLEKPCREQQLWEAVEEALRWDARNRRRCRRRLRIQRRLALLTAGEREVLRRLVAGKSNRATAAQLKLSVRTIEVRRAKLMRKLGVRGKADLLRYALRTGLLPPA
jgi:two-component system, LuxR family, response regulator FixJ